MKAQTLFWITGYYRLFFSERLSQCGIKLPYRTDLWFGGKNCDPINSETFKWLKMSPSAIEIKFSKKLLCWYLTSSRVPSNFALVARQNFAGFYFRNFSGQL